MLCNLQSNQSFKYIVLFSICIRCMILSLTLSFIYNQFHYKISQFYRRKYSIGTWFKFHQWFIYQHPRRRNFSVGFPFIGNTIFRRYICRKNKKTFANGFTDGNCTPKKKFPAWNIPADFSPSVIVWHTNGFKPSVTLSVNVWNTDRRYPSVHSSVIVAGTVKYQRITSVDKVVGECIIPTEYIRLEIRWWLWQLLSNADGHIPSVKPSVIIFKYVFKKLFRTHNIKLYKLMVIKTNYANKFFIKHQKQKK